MAIRAQQAAERGAPTVDLDVLEETALAMAQATIQNAMDGAQLTRAQLAQKLGCPKSFITRILSGKHNLTVRTLARVLAVCGEEVLFQRRPAYKNGATVATGHAARPALGLKPYQVGLARETTFRRE
ncbi:MAG: helix-turn-helix transcriptional regulator [Planctomycetota bacterium]